MDNAEMLGMEIGVWVLGQRYREAAEAPTLKAIQDSGDSVAEEIAKAEKAHEENSNEG